MVQWNPDLFDKYVSPDFSSFQSAEIPDIVNEYAGAKHWMLDYFLNTVLRSRWKTPVYQCVADFIRRAEWALTSYGQARAFTLAYLDNHDPTNPTLTQYYKALNEWETCLIQIQIALDLFRWVNKGEGAFVSGDGSAEQRCYDIANKVKHLANDLKSEAVTEDHVTPIWLVEDGIKAIGGLSCNYEEVRTVVLDLCKLAEELKDPLTFRENTLASRAVENH